MSNDNPTIGAALQVIITKIFEYIPMSMSIFHQSSAIVQHWMECYNITCELDDDDPCDIHIPEFEGTQAVGGLGVASDKFLNPLKIKIKIRVNIGSLKNLKFANIRDY